MATKKTDKPAAPATPPTTPPAGETTQPPVQPVTPGEQPGNAGVPPAQLPPAGETTPPPPPAPESPARNPLLDGLRLFQRGKEIKGDPVSDNYQVRAAKGVTVQKPWSLMAELRAAFRGCEFTFLAK